MSRAARFTPFVWLVGLGACNSILGIDDLHEGPRPGSGGEATTGATSNSNGGESNGGESNSGESNGGESNGGESNGGESNGGGGTNAAGTSNGGGVNPAAGAGGEGGTSEIGTPGGTGQGGATNLDGVTVRGHIIDFWGHAVPSIPVQIGDTLASTDAKGEFVFEDVPATYDVSFVFDHPDFPAQSDAWVYQGLTRRDPTLQMYSGVTKRSGDVDIAFVPQPTITATQTIWVALGGADGGTVFDDIPASGDTGTYGYWFGPATAQQTAHGLLWQTNAAGLPTSYLAYDSALVALATTGTTKISLDLSAADIDSANVQGTVTDNASGGRTNQVYLRFNSNARMTLVDDSDGPNSFSYVTPSIPNSTLTVVATEGSQYDGWAVAHADGLAPGAKPTLKIPPIVTALTPSGGATNVSATTKFSFQSATGQIGPFVLQFYSQPDDLPYQTIYIVTTKKQLTLPPIIGGGFNLYPNSDYLWSVATHGSFTSVDGLAEEGGFLDEFSRDEETADGPRNTSGEFSDSVPRRFTTAP